MFDAHVHADATRNPAVLDDLEVGGYVEGVLVIPPNDEYGDDQWALDLGTGTELPVGVVVREPFAATPEDLARLAETSVDFVGVRVILGSGRETIEQPALTSDADGGRVVVHVQNPTGQWDAIGRFAARSPARNIAIDHLGHPPVAEGVDALSWRGFLALADHDNVFVKFPNLVHFAGSLAAASRLAPFVRDVLECFGEERLVWASDWPRCGDAPYRDVVEAGADLLDTCGARRDMVFTTSFLRLHAGSATHA